MGQTIKKSACKHITGAITIDRRGWVGRNSAAVVTVIDECSLSAEGYDEGACDFFQLLRGSIEGIRLAPNQGFLPVTENQVYAT